MDVESTPQPRDNLSSEPKGWIREGTKIGPVLEVTINYHQGKPGIEIRIKTVSGDGSHSWVRISNELNMFLRDLTEKSRILGQEVDDSARTAQPSSQELRIAPHSQKKPTNPAQRQNWSRLQVLFSRLLWNTFRFIRGNGWILNWLRKGTVLWDVTFRREWLHCFGMNRIFFEKKTEQ